MQVVRLDFAKKIDYFFHSHFHGQLIDAIAVQSSLDVAKSFLVLQECIRDDPALSFGQSYILFHIRLVCFWCLHPGSAGNRLKSFGLQPKAETAFVLKDHISGAVVGSKS